MVALIDLGTHARGAALWTMQRVAPAIETDEWHGILLDAERVIDGLHGSRRHQIAVLTAVLGAIAREAIEAGEAAEDGAHGPGAA